MILDMSGFTLLTQRHGLIHYLGMVRRMQVATEPIVKRFNGQVIKYEADNMYAVFETCGEAIRAGISINLAMDAMNTITEDSKDLYVSIGISYGKILEIEGKDIFGDSVNLASKLGEDIAERGEILVTKEAWGEISNKADFNFEEIKYSVSGVKIAVYKVKY